MKIKGRTGRGKEELRSENTPFLSLDFVGLVSPSLQKVTYHRPYSEIPNDMFPTSGAYSVSFNSHLFWMKKRPKNDNFFIRGDIWKIERAQWFETYDDFMETVNGNQKLSFILRYCDGVDRELFNLAKDNMGVAIPFCFNFRRYLKDVGGGNASLTVQDIWEGAYAEKLIKRDSPNQHVRYIYKDKDPITGEDLKWR